MSLDFSDPRLIAYALDELDAAERAEVEAQLVGDPERRRLVEEIRATARLLTEHFQNEPRPKLAPEQREAIEARLQTAKLWRKWRRRRPHALGRAAILSLTLATLAAAGLLAWNDARSASAGPRRRWPRVASSSVVARTPRRRSSWTAAWR